MGVLRKIKQTFCRHKYPEHWHSRFKGTSVVFYRYCTKCGKLEEFHMPISDIDPAMRRLQQLRRNYKV